MAKKIRSLASFYIPSLEIVLNFDDELEIEDQTLVDSLVEKGLVDVLIEEPKKKPAKRRVTKKVEEEKSETKDQE